MSARRTPRRTPASAEDLMRLAGIEPAAPALQLVPADDLRLIVGALMELLQHHREQLDAYGKGLRRSYESFACDLRTSGFRFDETDDRHERARAQRRLGELSERCGNVDAALTFYELALRSWPEIGCRRRLEYLKRHLP